LDFKSISSSELFRIKAELESKYREFQSKKLKLNMSRGKPGADQLALSMGMLETLDASSATATRSGDDCRNYGLPFGIDEMRGLMAEIMEVDAENVIVGGNSSLNMMFDTVCCGMTHGFSGCEPWIKQKPVKFLCPSPGYDRHFAVTEYFGIDMITIRMTPSGPDMDAVEELVRDESVKGIWCVPKYQNPTGITFSDETVRRFAALRPAAPDFLIFWDNSYCVHDLTDTPDVLLNLWEACKAEGTLENLIVTTSTSKITFPGAGVAALAAGPGNLAVLKKRCTFSSIGPDKLNQLRHYRFLRNKEGVMEQMKKHREILSPKFGVVMQKLESELDGKGIASWTNPRGGYFFSVDVLPGCAKRVVALCEQAGVVLTGAGATFPYGKDPADSNIRLAPTYPPIHELEQAMDLFCICVQLAAVEKILAQ
jgi:DNA-binding transcriptional MocR family regulator